MKAKVTFLDERSGTEVIDVNGHSIQYGGPQGDGYCHAHDSFACAKNLTEQEIAAINSASYDYEEISNRKTNLEALREYEEFRYPLAYFCAMIFTIVVVSLIFWLGRQWNIK